MYSLVTGLIFLVAILLILIVLVQNSKGGGLASNFSSSNQVMGVRKTTDFLEKATWYLAVGLLVLSVMASATIPKGDDAGERSQLELSDISTQDGGANFPTTAPDLGDDSEVPAEETPDLPTP